MKISKILILIIAICLPATVMAAELPLPSVPDSLRTPQKRAAFLVAHYFDRLGEMDSTSLADSRWVEETFAQFLGLVPYAADQSLESASDAFAVLARGVDIHLADELAETYLHNPDSPAYDDFLYIAWLKSASANSPDDLRRDIFAHKAEVASRNMPGTIAMDFAFKPLQARAEIPFKRLSDVPGEKLLVFFDPDCTTCRRAISRLSSNKALNQAVEAGRLTVVAVYHDAEPEHLAEASALVPQLWTGVYEEGEVGADELYELILAPTIYLISADGEVLQRNPAIDQIIIPE